MLRAAPNWLPYRVRSKWNHLRVVQAIRGLNGSAPVRAASPDKALAEVHMLLCRRDVEIGVLALKSLLRFPDASWAVTITNDGSITDAQRRWIDHHIAGCRWLPKMSSDPRMIVALENRPCLSSLYRSDFPHVRKLLHPALLSDCERVMLLDSDTAFWQRPEALVAWASHADARSLFLHDAQDESVMVPAEVAEAFEELRHLEPRPAQHWSMPYFFFNAGLLAYRRDQFDVDVAEQYLKWRETAPAKYTTGKPGLWFGSWTQEQTSYQLIFARMNPAARPLGDGYRIGAQRGEVFTHFLWLQLIQPSSLEMLRALVDTLPRS